MGIRILHGLAVCVAVLVLGGVPVQPAAASLTPVTPGSDSAETPDDDTIPMDQVVPDVGPIITYDDDSDDESAAPADEGNPAPDPEKTPEEKGAKGVVTAVACVAVGAAAIVLFAGKRKKQG